MMGKKKVQRTIDMPGWKQDKLYQAVLVSLKATLKKQKTENPALDLTIQQHPQEYRLECTHSVFQANILFFQEKIEVIAELSLLGRPLEPFLWNLVEGFLQELAPL